TGAEVMVSIRWILLLTVVSPVDDRYHHHRLLEGRLRDQLRQDLADRAAQELVGQGVHLGRLGVEDHDAGAVALGGRYDAGGGIDAEGGADREHEVAGEGAGLGALHVAGKEVLAEGDGAGLEDASAAAAARVVVAAADALEHALDRAAVVARHA